jgi:hypothetical protein
MRTRRVIMLPNMKEEKELIIKRVKEADMFVSEYIQK